jgi:uncharacterized protein (TIGR03435 family)
MRAAALRAKLAGFRVELAATSGVGQRKVCAAALIPAPPRVSERFSIGRRLERGGLILACQFTGPVPRRLALPLVLLTAAVAANAQPARSFEVASVKENASASQTSFNSGPVPGRYIAVNIPLRFIILDAFGVRDHQLAEGPAWTETTRFDITATYPAGSDPDRDWRPMLRQLLVDRFRLVTHSETRQVPSYDLVAARGDGTFGRGLKRSDVDCEKVQAERRTQGGAGAPTPIAAGRDLPACTMRTTRQTLTARARPMTALLGPLQSLTGRPVIDRTSLAGNFDIDLQWTTSGDLGVTPAAADGISIFTALQEQAGLKLEPSRAPFEVVVIDSIARPAAD